MNIKEGMVLLVLFVAVIGFSFYYRHFIIDIENDEERVCFGDDCFFVEIAKTNEERMRGLMFRESLEDDRGMFFIFDEENVYAFWMKDTLIPLDMIWINSEKEVVFIQENAVPCEEEQCKVYNPGVSALYVLEINGGGSREIGLDVGERAEFDFEKFY
jgi:uncharacterized protein